MELKDHPSLREVKRALRWLGFHLVRKTRHEVWARGREKFVLGTNFRDGSAPPDVVLRLRRLLKEGRR